MADLKSRRRARKLADERNLVGVANDTKWGEFFKKIVSLDIPLEVKLLYESEPVESTRIWLPAKNYIDSNYGPELFVFVEWVRSSAVAEVSRIANIVGLVFSVKNAEITVYGYK